MTGVTVPRSSASVQIGVLTAHAAMIDAVAKGTITVDEGTAISALLAAQLNY
jgi:hypothetical protein